MWFVARVNGFLFFSNAYAGGGSVLWRITGLFARSTSWL